MVRTFSTKFPAKHPRQGEETFFVEKVINGEKIHTFRAGFSVKDGCLLSPSIWRGKPYKPCFDENGNKIPSIIKFMDDVQVFTQVFVIVRTIAFLEVYIKEGQEFRRIDEKLAAKNDGLSYCDFKGWFTKSLTGQIIHLTNFRY